MNRVTQLIQLLRQSARPVQLIATAFMAPLFTYALFISPVSFDPWTIGAVLVLLLGWYTLFVYLRSVLRVLAWTRTGRDGPMPPRDGKDKPARWINVTKVRGQDLGPATAVLAIADQRLSFWYTELPTVSYQAERGVLPDERPLGSAAIEDIERITFEKFSLKVECGRGPTQNWFIGEKGDEVLAELRSLGWTTQPETTDLRDWKRPGFAHVKAALVIGVLASAAFVAMGDVRTALLTLFILVGLAIFGVVKTLRGPEVVQQHTFVAIPPPAAAAYRELSPTS